VEEYSESHRAHGLPDDLLNILKDDFSEQQSSSSRCEEAHSEIMAEV
jgi:hypothetical protein